MSMRRTTVVNGNWTLRQWEPPPPPDGLRYVRQGPLDLCHQANIEMIALGNLGMSIKTIAAFTGLPPSTVSYRLRIYGIQIRAFREGRGPIAQLVFERLAKRVTTAGIQLVREKLI